ncbi:MAG: DUF5597 domain-containing protein, partial [Planctomycetaceae bacterium]|nr:DUF5597 domain-containing protein [Planctomycetaceae bacterium]
HLEKQGDATRLIVHGKPYLMIAGELHNSSSSNLEYMKKVWPKLRQLNLNTVLLPISWEQFEPEEGKFDDTLVDGLIRQARENDMKLVFLWFGSWKNGVSSYAPAWVKKDTVRFPRAKGSSNRNTKDILSTLSESNRDADARAFAALMRRIRDVDSGENTVIMVQVENEIGIKPELRDMSGEADRLFAENVPKQLMDFLVRNKEHLHPEMLKRWEKSGFATSGSWNEVFGDSRAAAEIFSTWYYALYVQHVIQSGKAEYPLPMYVNAWLADQPASGTYPSGGPVAHVLDVWRAAAPGVDIYAPDIYLPDFKGVCEEYSRNGSPLLVPEAHRGEDAAGRAYWVFGKHHGLCFAPFGIESMPEDHPLVDAYALLKQAMPLIAAAQGTPRMTAVYEQEKQEQHREEEVVALGDWNVIVKYHGDHLPQNAKPAALIIQSEENAGEFYLIGQGFEIGFGSRVSGPRNTQILSIDMGRFEEGRFVPELRLNGDESGANWRASVPASPDNKLLEPSKPRILRVRVDRFD